VAGIVWAAEPDTRKRRWQAEHLRDGEPVNAFRDVWLTYRDPGHDVEELAPSLLQLSLEVELIFLLLSCCEREGVQRCKSAVLSFVR
jgi:hypothetical protein